MNIFDIIMEEANPAVNGFSSVEIDSPIGILHTFKSNRKNNSPYLLKTNEAFTFTLFGKKYIQYFVFENIGTNEDPEYNPKEVEAIQKALDTIKKKGNTIKKALYNYLCQYEREYFSGYDYDKYTESSKTCRSLMNDSVCREFYNTVELDVGTFNGKTKAYLSISNDNCLFEWINCTIFPEIKVYGSENI